MSIPAGFKPLQRSSPFNTLVGPLYTKGEGVARTIGLLAADKHLLLSAHDNQIVCAINARTPTLREGCRAPPTGLSGLHCATC